MFTKLRKLLFNRIVSTTVIGIGILICVITHDFTMLAVLSVVVYLTSIMDVILLKLNQKLLKSYTAAVKAIHPKLTVEQQKLWKEELAKSFLPLKVKYNKPEVIDI